MGDSQFLPGTRHHNQSPSYTRQIQHFSRSPIQIGQTNQNRMGTGSISSEFRIPDAQISQCGFVCDPFQPQTPIVCFPSSRQPCVSRDALSLNWNYLHAYAFTPRILIPSVLENISQYQCRIVLIAPFWPQQLWFSELPMLLVSDPIRLPLFPRLLTQSKRRFQNLPVLDLHAWELSNNQSEIENVADFVSKSRRTSTQKVYGAKWINFSNCCRRKKVNPVSTPITVIADFLIFLFSEKKCQISTI